MAVSFVPAARRLLGLALLTLSLTLLASCAGYHVRGTPGAELAVQRASVSSGSAPYVGLALNQTLLEFSVDVVSRSQPAEAHILLADERFDRRVLSVDATTGRVQEVELALSVQLSVTDDAGTPLLRSERIQLERDYVFNETALLGNVEQEGLIRQKLAEDVALTIALRLEAIDAAATMAGESR